MRKMTTRKSTTAINCSVKPLYYMKLGDPRSDFHPGCAVIDVSFPAAFNVEISEIRFQNFYTYQLTVKVCRKQDERSNELTWKTCVANHKLMPNAHCEEGAEDHVTISAEHFLFPVTNVTAMRFVLRQPSPVWKEFRLDNIQLFKQIEEIVKSSNDWTADREHRSTKRIELPGVTSLPSMCTAMQNMLALSHQVTQAQPKRGVGRYDVEGSYEINLLSYT